MANAKERSMALVPVTTAKVRRRPKAGAVLAQVPIFNPKTKGALRTAQALQVPLTVEFDGFLLVVRAALEVP